MDGYNPRYKFDYILRCLIHNVNFLTKNAKLYIYGYKTSWETESCGEEGGGLTGRITNKTGITKSVQIFLVSDVHHIRPRAYRLRHKLHVKPPGWNAWGNIEVKGITEVMNLVV